uniref:Methyltransferase n=1 Tax=viral metagenome TaxID=1070528 RepID=A0A6C0I652_9ZZZZ
MKDIINICKPFSMISTDRFTTNIQAVIKVENDNIQGDIVEIGVWKGGSILSMILAYERLGKQTREFHLYDTFEGMTQPTPIDKDLNNWDAKTLLLNSEFFKCICPYDSVKNTIETYSKYPKNKIFYHVGDILKNTSYPEKIAILRLDTDWYESTKFELDNFYQYVSPGGIVIIDDYGHWQGCKKAVDEFLSKHPDIILNRSDYTGVYFIKPPINI